MHGEDSLTDSQRLTVSALATSRAATIFPKLENHNRAGHNKEHDSPEQVSWRTSYEKQVQYIFSLKTAIQ